MAERSVGYWVVLWAAGWVDWKVENLVVRSADLSVDLSAVCLVENWAGATAVSMVVSTAERMVAATVVHSVVC